MRILLILVLCLVAVSYVSAQLNPFTAQPVLYYTFDSSPSDATLAAAACNFTWLPGFSGHSGLAYFDGVGYTLANHVPHFIDLSQFSDNFGKYMPSIIGGEMTFEFWASFGSLNNNGHLLDIGLLQTYNLFISNAARTNEFQFFSNSAWLYANYAIHPNTWQHIVVTVSQNLKSDSTSAVAANYTFYCNGVVCPGLGQSNPVSNPLPIYTARTNAYISKSAWAATATASGDSFFQGWVDSFAYYNYGLSQEQIQVHYLVPRLPAFELTFSRNPNAINSSPSYAWLLQDPADGTLSQYHQGLLTLASASSQFVNMSSNSSAATIGTVIPAIGGTGSGSAVNGLTMGWSFEVIVKFASATASSTVFELSTNTGSDSIGLGISSGSALQFYATNTRLSSSVTLQISSSVTVNQWYHITIVMLSATNTITAYVNGNVSSSTTSTAFPDALQRGNSLLGKSYNNNVYASLTLDAFRIYDVALPSATIYTLAQLTVAPLVTPSQPVPSVPVVKSGPVSTYTFDVSPATFLSLENENSYFLWTAGSGARTGIAYFDGVSVANEEYVNLRDYPDSYGNTFPAVIGGSMSFEMWALASQSANNLHYFDLAGITEYYDNNIFMSTYLSGTKLSFQWFIIYGKQSDPLGNFNNQYLSTASITVNQWYHLVATVQQVSSDVTSSTAALMCLYINGILDNNCTTSYLPQYVDRPSSFLARSNWDSDPRFAGSIDSFMYYNYALSAEQALAHSKLNRPPLFENTFSIDPRNSSTYTYSWLSSDPTDVGSAHQGLLVLNSANSNYVNLATSTGLSSAGPALPSFGGAAPNQTAAPASGVTVGWTIEILFKPTSFNPGASIFDFGNSGTQDEITLKFATASSSQLTYTYNSAYPTPNGVQVTNVTILTQWYHAVIIYTPTASSTLGTETIYVNGVLTSTATTGYPQSSSRLNALLGKSIGGLYTSVKIDAVRVYDYALSQSVVTSLWGIVASSSPNVNLPPAQFSSTGTSGGSDSLSAGAIAGIIIGAVFGVLLICCVLFFLCFMRPRQKKSSSSSDYDNTQPHSQMEKSDEDVEMTS